MTESKKPIRLSKPQFDLLESLSQEGQRYVASYYAPACKLVQYGVAEWTGKANQILKITEAGELLLQLLKSQKEAP